MAAVNTNTGAQFVDATSGRKFMAITKSDSTDLTPYSIRALWVGGAGDVAVMGIDDTAAVTISAVPAGTLLPFNVKRVMSTNTTATLIVGVS